MSFEEFEVFPFIEKKKKKTRSQFFCAESFGVEFWSSPLCPELLLLIEAEHNDYSHQVRS